MAPATAGRSTWTTSADLQERLGASVRARLGADATIEGLRRLPGGASREIWQFTVVRPGVAPEPLVLRRDPPGHVIESSRETEVKLLQEASRLGVPVPEVRWCEEPATFGSSGFVMQFVAGETIARRLLRDAEYATARDVLPEQLAAALVNVHRMEPDASLARPDGVPAAQELARYADILHGIAPDPHPVIELGIRWLGNRLPPPADLTVVHGDYRIGNVIVGPEGLRSVIDWELTHVGDPMEDVGWLCVRAWRFGVDDKPVGGLCDRERFWAAYERAGGRRVDPAVARWWEVFGNLKWAIICIMQAQTFLGGVQNVELASLGRRTVETELELLDLMEA